MDVFPTIDLPIHPIRILRFSRAIEQPATKAALQAVVSSRAGQSLITDDAGRVVGIEVDREFSSDVSDIIGREGANPEAGAVRYVDLPTNDALMLCICGERFTSSNPADCEAARNAHMLTCDLVRRFRRAIGYEAKS